MTRLNRSSNRRLASPVAQRCSFVWIPSTRPFASTRLRLGASVFTGDLLTFQSFDCELAAALGHVIGFPDLGLLRRLRPAPMPSTDDEPSRRRPGWPVGREHRHGSHVHHRFPRQARRPAMPQRPSTSTPQTFPVTTRPDLTLHSARAPRRRTKSTSEFAAAQPTSARFELVVSLEGLYNAGSSRTPFCLASQAQAVWQYRPVPSLSGLLPTLPGASRIRLPPASTGLLRQPGGEGLSPPLESTAPRGAPHRRTTGRRSRAARAGGVDELRGEGLHPAVDRDVVDSNAALGQQLLDIAIRQAVAQLPAHRDRDHLPREAEAGRRRRTDPESTTRSVSSAQRRPTNATVPPRHSRTSCCRQRPTRSPDDRAAIGEDTAAEHG